MWYRLAPLALRVAAYGFISRANPSKERWYIACRHTERSYSSHDSAGIPLVCVVKTPNIYGIPRAGRCLQRKVFPWCTDIMGLRQLDRGEPENTVRSDMFLVQTRYKEDEKLLMTCENSPHAAAKKSTAPPSPRLLFSALLVMF